MAEEEVKAEEAAAAPAAEEANDDFISLDDLDKIIEDESGPEFTEELKKMESDSELDKAEIEDSALQDELVETVEAPAEEKKKTIYERLPFLKKFQAPIEKVSAKVKLRFLSIKNRLRLLLVNTKSLFIEIIPGKIKLFISNTKDFVKFLKSWLAKTIESYKAKSKKQKIGHVVAIGFIIGMGFIIKETLGNSWIGLFNEKPSASFVNYSESTEKFDRKTEMVEFYKAFPQPKFTVLLDKVVVNLKRTNSFANPMGAFEFYLDADSQETAIEIKDREKQILDVMQRTVEEFTYQELRSKIGASKLRSSLRQEVNNVLNQGRVDRIYLKTSILKP